MQLSPNCLKNTREEKHCEKDRGMLSFTLASSRKCKIWKERDEMRLPSLVSGKVQERIQISSVQKKLLAFPKLGIYGKI